MSVQAAHRVLNFLRVEPSFVFRPPEPHGRGTSCLLSCSHQSSYYSGFRLSWRLPSRFRNAVGRYYGLWTGRASGPKARLKASCRVSLGLDELRCAAWRSFRDQRVPASYNWFASADLVGQPVLTRPASPRHDSSAKSDDKTDLGIF